MNILDYIGYVFGYVIFFGYKISGVYVVGLLLFTIVVKLIMLPTSIKQQKTSAKQARISPKLKELQEMYKNNPTKFQEEQSALYAKENVSMMSGCLPMLIQLPIIYGLYRAIINPLTCVLHFSVDKVNAALQYVTMPSENYYYQQSELINQFASIRDKLVSANIFTDRELHELDGLSSGAFNLFHLNLLDRPTFTNILILIPILCFVSSVAMTLFTMKGTGAAATAGQPGCTKWGMPIGMAAFSTWFAFSVPGAVGLYWILQNLVAIVQTMLMNKYYNMNIMAAMDEAARYARRENEETAVLSKFGGVDIQREALELQEKNDTAVVEKDNKTASIYESIDQKNIIEVAPRQVIKTGNATRAGNNTASRSKKKKK